LQVSPQDVIIMKLNYGLVLKQVDSLDVVTDVWVHTFKVALPSLHNFSAENSARPNCRQFGDTQTCRRIIDLVAYLQNMTDKAVDQILGTMREIQALMPPYPQRGRHVTRGLLDFVGELSHSLFKTARDSDVENVHRIIVELKEREDHLLKAWEKSGDRLASYNAAINRRVDAPNDMIATQKQAVYDLYLDIQTATNE